MSQITKRALAASLKRLLAEKPLSKITISDITDDCGINRMTFYYHFQDIYDLIEWICLDEGGRAIEGKKDYKSWQDGLVSLCHVMLENRAFIEGVYHSVQREQLENYLYRVVYSLLFDVIEEIAKDRSISAEDMRYIANFYKYAFAGVMLEWVKNSMRESPESLAENISRLVRGQFSLAIENMSAV